MTQKTSSILIVGGGTAGWLSAAIIASYHRDRESDQLKITLVEASNIPTVGVGEGTWPTLRNTVRSIGLDEKELFQRCFAGFKQGGKFVNWVTHDDYYYHPFTVPLGYGQMDLAPYVDNIEDFSLEANFQEAVCEAGLAPRQISEGAFQGICNYAYHLDAGAFAEMLKEYCRDELGVEHVIGTVNNVEIADDGFIDRLSLESGGEAFELKADLYVDCSGFRSLLLGQALGVEFISNEKYLFNDTALAVRVPYEDDDAALACHTIATGQNAGWTWDIGLTNRRGVGHVYSSAFLSDDEATQNLENYIGQSLSSLDVKKIKFKSANLVSVGWHGKTIALELVCQADL